MRSVIGVAVDPWELRLALVSRRHGEVQVAHTARVRRANHPEEHVAALAAWRAQAAGSSRVAAQLCLSAQAYHLRRYDLPARRGLPHPGAPLKFGASRVVRPCHELDTVPTTLLAPTIMTVKPSLWLSLSTLLLTFSGVLAGVQYSRYDYWKERAVRKTAEWQSARRDAGRILQLRRLPRQAAEQAPDQQALHAILESLVRDAGLPPTALASIEPSAPQRLARSAYEEVTTTVTLKSVPLRPLTELLFHLRTQRREFHLKSLTLRQSDRPRALWDASVVVAVPVFQPAQGLR